MGNTKQIWCLKIKENSHKITFSKCTKIIFSLSVKIIQKMWSYFPKKQSACVSKQFSSYLDDPIRMYACQGKLPKSQWYFYYMRWQQHKVSYSLKNYRNQHHLHPQYAVGRFAFVRRFHSLQTKKSQKGAFYAWLEHGKIKKSRHFNSFLLNWILIMPIHIGTDWKWNDLKVVCSIFVQCF